MNRVFKTSNNSTEFYIYLTPGCHKSSITGLIQNNINTMSIKVSVHSRPVENQANIELIKLISKLFNIPKSRVQIKQGAKSRHKLILINNYKMENIPQDIQKLILQYL